MRLPKTPQEWQEAVNLAEALLRVESCRAYGLITGGPEIKAWRCDVILTRGERKGFHPQEETIMPIILGLAGVEP